MKYRITKAALMKAVMMSQALDESAVLGMAEFSAPITHKLGNRRYDEFILRVKGSLVIDINLASAGKNGKPVVVICDTCEADGKFCHDCGSMGCKYV